MLHRVTGARLTAYLHDELTPEEARRTRAHLDRCARCRAELEQIRLASRLMRQLPQGVAPVELWDRVESGLNSQVRPERRERPAGRIRLNWRWGTAAATLLLAAALWKVAHRPARQSELARPGWEVARVAGMPRIGREPVASAGRLGVGQWLETDAASQAQLRLPAVGQIDVEPGTRLRLAALGPREQRIQLARGAVRARVTAPPRLFLVDTPSATAIDLGCAYRLAVDGAGGSLLHVTTGVVALDWAGREVTVPAGAVCETRRGLGPGTPYFQDAPAPLKAALAKLDFQGGGPAALGTALASTRPHDAFSLWHLLFRVNGPNRRRVFDRLRKLVPPPPGVTRAGALRLDPAMLVKWRALMDPPAPVIDPSVNPWSDLLMPEGPLQAGKEHSL